MSTAEPTPAGPTPQELKSALKAFRKRLKLTQLDDQSRIGKSPLSGGHGSAIVAITPPDQFPASVWEEACAARETQAGGEWDVRAGSAVT